MKAGDVFYIGDGVYASFDGYSIVLETQRTDGCDKIYLEPSVCDELLSYIKRVRDEE